MPAAACERIFSVLYAPYRTCLRKYVRCGKIKLESQHPHAAYSTKEAGAHVLAGHRNQAVCIRSEGFADAFNYLIYDGEQVTPAEQLTHLDATQFAIPYREDDEGKPEATQKYRDVLKTLAVKTDERCTYLVLGIENQSNVHYAMPVRNMLYDAMQYEKQVRQLAAAHRKKHDAATSDEYLSGMSREDKIAPVITLVINFWQQKMGWPT